MIDITRNVTRIWLASAFAVLGLFSLPQASAVDKLKIMVPANAGGGWDQTGRSLQQAMQTENVVKNVEVENKGGAAGTIGLAHFFSSTKGNPNALMIGGSVMVGGIVLNKTPVKLSQLTPIARLTGEYDILVVSAESPIRSVKHLIKQFKENPESVIWGGGSAGGTDHLIVGMIAQSVGVDPSRIRYVPFAGGGAAHDAIIKGEVTVGLSGWSEFASAIAAGKMRPIGVTSEQRMLGIRMPTLKENGINVAMANWRAVFAPAGITDAQRKALIAAVEKTVRGDAWRDTLIRNQWTDLYLSGDEFKEYLVAEQQRIEKVMDALGLVK